MTRIQNVSAIIFDMDGTLVDSEIFTERAVHKLCCELGVIDADIDCSAFDGVSWEEIGTAVVQRYPTLKFEQKIARRLHEIYQHLMVSEPPPLINRAREAVIAAHELMPIAIVSSSQRESIEETIRRMDIASYIRFYAGAEDCDALKPAPDGYLQAAKELRVNARECLVFEDSITGILAARNAGMQVVAVTHGSSNVDQISGMADMAINDYSELEDRFFERIRSS